MTNAVMLSMRKLRDTEVISKEKTIDLITKMYVSPSRVLTYVAFYLLLAPEG